MDSPKNKFSDIVESLVETWWLWMAYDRDSKNDSLTYGVRREAAEKCEGLIALEYSLIEKLNNFFDK